MSKVKNENFIVIQGFMLNDLQLKGNELLVYAIIYGFSQTEGQCFNGSLQYLADWTNSTKQGVMKNLKSLVEKGFIEKNETMLNGVKFVSYYATEFNGVLNKVSRGMQQSLTGYETEFNGGMKQSLPNNTDNNKINNQNNKINKKERFTPPTVDDVRAYCEERQNGIDPEQFVDFYTSKGWKIGKETMKDWKASIRTWERRNNTKPKNKTEKVAQELDEFYDMAQKWAESEG